MDTYAVILLAAGLGSWLATPACIRIARRLGVVDRPDLRKEHEAATPYLGGVAVLTGIAVGLVALAAAIPARAEALAHPDERVLVILCGAVAIFLLGLADDFRPLRARYKLLAQVAVAAFVWNAGVRFDGMPLLDGTRFDLDCAYVSLPLTVLWIVGVTNALNLIDGLDGLASGIGTIAAGAIAFVAFDTGNGPIAAVLAALAAAQVGFLLHNRHPAKIFLGDAGSLLIGFLLASCAVVTASTSTSFVALGAPLLALAVPLLDLLFTVLRRLIERRGIFSPDRNHIHYRLLALGHSHARTVTMLWVESAALTALALVLFFADASPAQQLATLLSVGLAHVLFFRFAGAVRLRDSLRAFHAAALRLRQARANQRECDGLDLLFRRARSLDDWWQAIETSARRLGCTAVSLELPRRRGGVEARRWQRARALQETLLQSTVEVPDRRAGDALRVHVSVAGESLESAANRMALLAKLLDCHPAAQLGAAAGRVASTPLAELA
ncbi:MAG: glycosyltransferase family 4 protein [Planctomycetota bacterium]